eukprot:TRINITY_DN1323_c1_g1_i1.p1 TRINITY_DN1323_c1_g1~~TRINITY_DN1323_c1_g1_i1.p1  ORF type:complete len:436 (+),score=37.85 TRINITY_DN1323_c1_g1_i1:26-1309(+)
MPSNKVLLTALLGFTVVMMLRVIGTGRGGEKGLHYTVGICASVKDDDKWLEEWIDFHEKVGVEQIFLIDDGSTDNTASIIQKYQKQGIVTKIPGEVPQGDSRCILPDARDSAYIAKCYDHAAPLLDWMIIIDTDEYLFPRQGCSVKTYITQTCNTLVSHIPLHWEMFGSSGHLLHPEGGLRENFLTSGGDCSAYVDQWGSSCAAFGGNCKECRHTKYIANTKRCLKSAVHCHNHFPERLRLADNKCDITPDPIASCKKWWEHGSHHKKPVFEESCCGAGLGLNHYSPKSEEARRWRSKRKMRNGLGNDRDATPGMDKRDLNYVLSTDILRFTTNETCFTERGWAYTPRPGHAPNLTSTEFIYPALASCTSHCLTATNCHAFTYRPSYSSCNIFGYTAAAWPPSSIPLIRERRDGYISGVPIRGQLCR